MADQNKGANAKKSMDREDVEPVVEERADGADPDYEEPTQEEWRKALEDTIKQRDEYLDLAQRKLAEFANYKKRNETIRADAYDDGVRDVLTAMLPFVDNLERAIAAAKAHGEQGALLEGIEMTQKLLLEATSKLGLEEVEALGQKFDPELHNAVMRAEEGEPGVILEVFQKGYRARGRMLRYPMVKVAGE